MHYKVMEHLLPVNTVCTICEILCFFLQVPAYQGDDGFCLFESNAIAHYCTCHIYE